MELIAAATLTAFAALNVSLKAASGRNPIFILISTL